jgi:large subunit ribosomal protein L3
MVPRVRAWSGRGQGLDGFAGYKAGMVQISMVDDTESPSKGQTIVQPVTVIEVPPVFVYGVIGYSQTTNGLKAVCEASATGLPKESKRTITAPKKPSKTIADLEKIVDSLSEVRVRAITQPIKSGLGKKTPETMEIAVCGKDAKEQLEYAKTILGKEVKFSDVFKEGDTADIIAVTKGFGWQGVVKRHGVALNIHKASQARRHGGSIGPERQGKVMFTVPRAGQMGFHRRVDRNKRVMKIATDAKGVTPKGGFPNYGLLNAEYALVLGSISGPAKRVVRLRKSILENPVKKPQVISILP